MANRKLLFRHFVFWAGFLFTAFSVAVPDARYFIYLLPFLVTVAILGDGSVRLGDETKPFLILILVGFLSLPFSNLEGAKDTYFIVTGVSSAFLVDIPRIRLWTIFITILVCASIYFIGFRDFNGPFYIDVINSYSPFEGKFGFIFALLCPFALMERRYILFLLCSFTAFLTLKRIAIAGLIVSSFLVLIGEKRARFFLHPFVMVLFNLAILSTILLYGYGMLDDLLVSYTGQSANQFGMGRQELLSLPSTEIIMKPEQFIIFGGGPGSSYVLANTGAPVYGGNENMHSDILKIFYEYGLVFFVLFIWLMYSSKSFPVRIAFAYLNIIFITDNTLIYSFMLFLLILCIRHADYERKRKALLNYSYQLLVAPNNYLFR